MFRFNPVTGEVDLAPVFSQRPGPAGEDGAPGIQGVQGEDGKDGRHGKDGPPGKDGVNGNDGKDGRDGKDANTIIHGTQPPTPSVGNRGDFFIDITTWTIYGPKAGSWPAGVCLVGANGSPGTDGCAGKDGKDGLNGRDGKDGKDGKDGARGVQGPPGSAPTGTFRLMPADYQQTSPSAISVSVS